MSGQCPGKQTIKRKVLNESNYTLQDTSPSDLCFENQSQAHKLVSESLKYDFKVRSPGVGKAKLGEWVEPYIKAFTDSSVNLDALNVAILEDAKKNSPWPLKPLEMISRARAIEEQRKPKAVVIKQEAKPISPEERQEVLAKLRELRKRFEPVRDET